MAYFLDEKKMINGNIAKYEGRMNSQTTRFLEKTPTFVTYYSINNVESTADNGFQQVEEYLGPNSPLRFNSIRDFPLYGIEQIVLDLSNDNEHGMDVSFEGEAIVLPNTITPKPFDFFTINHLDKSYVFIVNNIAYDTIKSNNYYKVNFTLKSVDGGDTKDLIKQTTDSFTCIFTNIGTKEKFLVRDDDVQMLVDIQTVYSEIGELYKTYFYNKRYNSFVFYEQSPFCTWYDQYLHKFINDHNLFNEKNNYQTLFLHMETRDPHFTSQYLNSFYRALELNRKDLVKDQKFIREPISSLTSQFAKYRLEDIRFIRVNTGTESYLGTDLIERILANNPLPDEGIVTGLLIKYFNGGIHSLQDLELDRLKEYPTFMQIDEDSFRLIPIMMFIIKAQYRKFMSIN